jgi:hypothetical protein
MWSAKAAGLGEAGDPQTKTVCAELVEAPLFLRRPKEKRLFDKLRANGSKGSNK